MEIQVNPSGKERNSVKFDDLTTGVWQSVEDGARNGEYIIVTEKEMFFVGSGSLETLEEDVWSRDEFVLVDTPVTITLKN